MESAMQPDLSLTDSAPNGSTAAGVIVSLALANARLQAALQQSLRELSVARAGVLMAGDVVRRKLSEDLHDGAQQRLTAIRIMASLASERTDDRDLAEAIESIGTAAEQAGESLRELAHGVYPALLANFGLGEALRAVARTSPVAIRVIDKGVGRRSPAVEAAIYFCSLEAIQNAIKHAGTGARVTVKLARDPGGVVFEVADDGVGMQLPPHGDGIGLRCMRDRIEAVGGRLEVLSSPGAGTRVHGRVPDAP
jgi:signal transduction histidine kinase